MTSEEWSFPEESEDFDEFAESAKPTTSNRHKDTELDIADEQSALATTYDEVT